MVRRTRTPFGDYLSSLGEVGVLVEPFPIHLPDIAFWRVLNSKGNIVEWNELNFEVEEPNLRTLSRFS